MWSVQIFCAQTSGEFGSGTARGFWLRVKMILEASSSERWVDAPLVVMEGAVLIIACLIAVSVSSEVVCVAMGAIGKISVVDESHEASWRV